MRDTTPFHPNPLLLIWENDALRACRLDQKQSWLVGDNTADIGISALPSGIRCGVFREVEGEWFYIDDPANPGLTLLNGRPLPRPLRGIRQPVPLDSGTVLRITGQAKDAAVMLFLSGHPADEWTCHPLSRREATRVGGSGILPPTENAPAAITYLNAQFYLSAGEGEMPLRFNRGRMPESAVLRDGDCISSEKMTMYFGGGLLFCFRGG